MSLKYNLQAKHMADAESPPRQKQTSVCFDPIFIKQAYLPNPNPFLCC